MLKIVGNVIFSESRTVQVENNIHCVSCMNNLAQHYHHILPYVDGGRTLIPICENCHNKIHNLNFQNHSDNIKKGMERARAKGKQIGAKKKDYDMMKLMELHNKGLSMRQIGKEMKMSPATVCRILNDVYAK